MANKKTQAKEKEAPKPDFTKMNQVDRDDLLPMQLAWKEMENSGLKLQMAQVTLEKAQKALEDSRAIVNEMNLALNTKYGLDAQKDRINIENGEITRG